MNSTRSEQINMEKGVWVLGLGLTLTLSGCFRCLDGLCVLATEGVMSLIQCVNCVASSSAGPSSSLSSRSGSQ